MTRELQVQTISIAKRCLFLISMLLTTLVANAQYSGYVGDSFTIPDPPDRYGYTAMNATFSSSSAHLYVDRYGWCQIRSYFTGTQTVICTCLYVRSDGTVGGNVPYTQTYYVTCNARNITGLPNSVTMEEGEEKTLSWNISPYSASAQVTWSTSNSSIVAVSQNGKLTAKSAGTAVVTAENNSGPDVNVYVTVNENKKVSLSATPSGGEVIEGTIVKLSSNVSGTDIYYTLDGSTPSRSSSSYTSEGITIRESCTLKAIGYKEDYETSTVLTVQYTAIAPVNPTAVSVSTNSKAIGVGESTSATYNITPANANVNTEVTWSSADQNIASVDQSGKVTGVKEGITFIIATTANGIVGSCKLMVKGSAVNTFDDGIGISSCSGGALHSAFVKNDGTLWLCGKNEDGALGDGTTTTCTKPFMLMTDVVYAEVGFTSGSGNTFIIKKNGSLWACGNNDYGQLGDGTKTRRLTPVKIMDDVDMVRTNGYSTFILKKDNSLWACGYNNSGNLGDGTKVTRTSPVKIMSDVAKLSGGSYPIAIKKDGSLWGWGYNEYGQLGDGTTTNRLSPIKITDNVQWASLGGHILIVKKDNSLWTCGINKWGQLCDGTTTERHTPVKVMEDVSFATTNGSSSLIVKTDGSLWGCGSNEYGYLGDGTKINRYNLVKLMEDVDSVAAGSGWPTFIIKKDGSLWGYTYYNNYGQLGNYNTEQQLSPVQIMKAPDGTPWNIEMANAELSINKGATCQLGYTLSPAKSTANVTWTSDDPKIASVDATGKITGVAVGTTYINAATANGKIDWCKVTVVPSEQTIRTSAAGYATFYDSQSAFSLPNGLTAQVVTTLSNNKLSYQSLSGGIIPKGVAVMLVGSSKQAATYTLTRSESATTYNGTNLLHGSDEGTTTTGDGLHYKLSYGPSNTSSLKNVFGWYWGADDGAPFQIEGHKAWLVIPKSSAATRGFAIDGNATGIDSLPSEEPENAVYYDLQGRRIDKPAKGVYISRGKKVIIK